MILLSYKCLDPREMAGLFHSKHGHPLGWTGEELIVYNLAYLLLTKLFYYPKNHEYADICTKYLKFH